jgi:hypothetical protein
MQAYNALPTNLLDSPRQDNADKRFSPILEEQEDSVEGPPNGQALTNGNEAHSEAPNGDQASEVNANEDDQSQLSADESDDDNSTMPPPLSLRAITARPPPASQPSMSFPSLSMLPMAALRNGAAPLPRSSTGPPLSSSQPNLSSPSSHAAKVIKSVFGPVDDFDESHDEADTSSEEEGNPKLRGRYAGRRERPLRQKTNGQPRGW